MFKVLSTKGTSGTSGTTGTPHEHLEHLEHQAQREPQKLFKNIHILSSLLSECYLY